MPARKHGKTNKQKGKQQNIQCMFKSMEKRNNINNINNKLWNKRQPGILASPKNKKCNKKPIITTEHKSIEGQTQQNNEKMHTSLNRTNRKRKFDMISSPNDYNTLYIDNDPQRKRIKALSISPSKGAQRRKIKHCNNNNNNNNHNHSIFSSFNNENNNMDKIDLFTFNSQEKTYSFNNNNTSDQTMTDITNCNTHNNNNNNNNNNIMHLNSIDEINLFTSFDEDRTPARPNRMTQFQKQRIINCVDSSAKSNQSNQSNPSHKKKTRRKNKYMLHNNNSNDSSVSKSSKSTSKSIPSSTSKSSTNTNNNNNIYKSKNRKNKNKHRNKIIIETEEDIDNIINVDPRRLSLEEHPLMSRKENRSFFDELENDSPNPNPPIHNRLLLLDSLLNNNNNNNSNNNNEFDYFDDDLDEIALVTALDDIDKHTTNTNIIKRLSFDNSNPCSKPTMISPSTPPTTIKMHNDYIFDDIQPAINFSPHSKRKVNSPLSQKIMSRSHSLTYNKNMGSIDVSTQNTQQQPPQTNDMNDRYYRFEVMEIINDYDTRSKILRVKDLKQKEQKHNYDHYDDEIEDTIFNNNNEQQQEWTIEIREDWYESIVNIGDIIHVIGETVQAMRTLFHQQTDDNSPYPICMIPNENIPIIIDTSYDIIVDNQHNYLVIHPDCLMIPTRIASSFPCTRREILANNIRFSGENALLLYGTMAHELFQETLKRGNCNHVNIQKDISYIISKYLIQLYSINETEQSATQKLSEFTRHITDFFYKFFQVNSTHHSNNIVNNVVDWGSFKQRLQITKVVDIEESIWSPMFGIRGNIDATIQIKTKRHLSPLEIQHKHNGVLTQQNEMNMNEFLFKLLPFELKTGKESGSSVQKARAQLALYSLMLADRYDTSTEGGLLYYLKTGHLMGVPLPHNEIRALLIRRNFLAKYFNSHPKIDKNDNVNVNVNDDNYSVKLHVQNKEKRKQKEFPSLLALHQKRICETCFSKAECFIYNKVQCYNNNISDICNNNITSTTTYKDMVSHLNDNHLEYINKWIELIDLEETYCLGTRHEIWAMDSVQRELKTGKCLANMIVSHHEIDQFKHIYTFIKHPDYYHKNNNNKYDRHNDHNMDKDIIKLWDLKFRINGYITISTEDGKYGLCSGTIIELNTKYVKFASKKPIKNVSEVIQSHQCLSYNAYSTQQRNDMIMYRLDIDDTAYGFSALRANILYYVMPSNSQQNNNNNNMNNNDEMNEIIHRKRQLLVDLLAPKFKNNCTNYFHSKIASHLQTAYNSLNIDQQHAVQHVLQCNDYALILGMPGTGKSSTIIFLLRLLISFGYKVMLTAYTNSAIDHLCLKLLKYKDVENKFVRIGNLLSINSKLRDYVLDAYKFNSIACIDKYLQSKNIVAVTSTSSTTQPILTSENKSNIFDYCIVDEAGQLTEPQVLGPLRRCRKFVLVGDSNQLPPLVQSKQAKRKGMNISLFERLAKQYENTAVKSLTIQYRMNEDILLLSNCLTYNGQMKCASDLIAKRKIKLNKSIAMDNNIKIWLKYAIDPNKNVILLNTDNLYNKQQQTQNKKRNKNNINEHEANMVEMIVNNLFKYGIYSSQIGVMAPYRSQLKLIKSKLDSLNVPLSPSQTLSQTDVDNDKKRESSLLLDTIDRFQGSDRDIIMISFTHTPFHKKMGSILNDWRRINVALTRARCKLILLASVTALNQSKSNMLKKIVEITSKHNWIYNVDSY